MNKTLVALLTGVAVGVLIAPAKGSETRKRLSKSFNDLTEDMPDIADELYQKEKNILRTGKDDAEIIAVDITDLAERL